MLNSRYMVAAAGLACVWPMMAAAQGGGGVERDELRAVVAEMLADAETRSSLLAGGGDAGYDKNFFMASADGNYKLNISGFVQIRYTLNFRDSSGVVGPADDFNPGFTINRAKIRFSGNVVNPDLTFAVQMAADRGDAIDFAGTTNTGGGNFNLDDCFVNYNVGNGWSVRGGQYKVYFLKEELNPDVYSMSLDRGMVNAAFTQSRSQGIGAKYKAENWWVGVDISDGLRTLNTDFTSTKESDFAVTGRFEYRFAGTDDQLKDYTSMPGDAMGAMVGGAVHYQLANNDPFFTAFDQNYLSYTVDGQIEGSGLSLFAAFVGSHTWRNVSGGGDPPDLDDFGVVVQGSWRFMANDEVFVKYDGIYLDIARGLSPDDYHFVTFGYNHYFAGHAAKITVDCLMSLVHTQGLQSTASGIVPSGANGNNGRLLPNTGQGLIGVSKGVEAALRFQFQLMF